MNVEARDLTAVRDKLLQLPNMNTTGRLPAVLLLHINMKVRITVSDERLAGKALRLEDGIWTRLNYGWSLGFLIAGILNLVVAYTFSTEIWVTYKFVGGPIISLIYVAITIGYLARGGYLTQLDKNEKKMHKRH